MYTICIHNKLLTLWWCLFFDFFLCFFFLTSWSKIQTCKQITKLYSWIACFIQFIPDSSEWEGGLCDLDLRFFFLCDRSNFSFSLSIFSFSFSLSLSLSRSLSFTSPSDSEDGYITKIKLHVTVYTYTYVMDVYLKVKCIYSLTERDRLCFLDLLCDLWRLAEEELLCLSDDDGVFFTSSSFTSTGSGGGCIQLQYS